MSQAVTVSTIQARVCQMCDLPTTLTANTTVTAAAMLDFIKTSCTLLAAVAKEYSDEEYFSTHSTVQTQAGVPLVSFPTGFSDLMRIVWQKSATEEVPLQLAVVDDWNATPFSGTLNPWSSYGGVKYRLQGAGSIELYPTPDAVYDLKLHYTTGIYITALTDVVVMRDGWDQWITLQTCMMVRARQQKDGAEFASPLAMLDGSIRRQMKRDRFGRRQIRNSRGSPAVDYFGRARRWPW